MFTILFYFFVAIMAIQLFYYLIVFTKFVTAKKEQINNISEPVSIIVCAKNEAENVRKNIPLLAQQNYSNFEIVLIDDASSDETLDLFEQFQQQYDNIKIVKVENVEAFWGNKKYALTLGIKAAKYDKMLFIDADCYPNSQNWLQQMANHYATNKNIVLGYGAYEKVKGSFLNKLIRFETVFTALQYFSWAKMGSPYMGVGRNLAYTKDTFFSVRGFYDHMKIPSGDDDLFINQVATSINTAIEFDTDAFTVSEPKQTFADWFLQKRRHITTAKYYKFWDRYKLGIFYCSQLLFVLLAALLLAFQYEWMIVLGLVAFRYLVTWIILGNANKKLDEKDLTPWIPVIEICLIWIQLQLFFSNLISKPTRWR